MNTGRNQVGDHRPGVRRVLPKLEQAGRILLRGARSARRALQDERGAVTAEYAIIIMAAVAFAGVLVAIVRSEQIREMLVTLVENALGSGG